MASSALIFKVNQLGDNIVFLPVIQRLVEDGAFEKLTLWTTPLAAPLYHRFRENLTLESVSRANFYPAWKNPLKLFSLSRRVRNAHADYALVAEDMGNTAYFLALASGAAKRVGTRPPYLKIPASINVPVSLKLDAPAAEKAWQLGSALAQTAGGSPWTGKPPPPDLSNHILPETESFDVVIHPGASREYKRWPSRRFHELAVRLSRDLQVGWFADPDVPLPPSKDVTIIYSKNLADLVSSIAKANLFIGNNSGPMNIASALGIPSIIFSGPSTRSWDPYWHPDRMRVLRHDQLPCIACDPPGLPIREVCTNSATPMACMKFWTVDRVEIEASTWLARWRP